MIGKLTYEELEQNNDQLKKTISELQRRENFFRVIFEHVPHGIIHFDRDGVITACNDNFIKIIGSSKEVLIGLNMRGLPDTGVVNSLDEALKGCTSYYEGEYSSVTAIKISFVRLIFSPIFSRDGIVRGGLGIIEDITKRKHAEEALRKSEEKQLKLEFKLRHSQKMETIGTLAAGIVHDFNNILFPILGYTKILKMDAPKNSPFQDVLDKIYTGTLRATDLVAQILTFSRQESRDFKLVKMQAIIEETLNLIRATIPVTIDIKHEIQAECGMIKADPTQIHQVAMNLITNACHAMENTGGELKVSLKQIELGENDLINLDMKPGGYAFLKVVDSGVGMDKDLTEKIFDPFFTTKEIGKGTGMGLAVVHGIINSMRGAIQVRSEPGKGTEFRVYIPVEKISSEEPKKQIMQSIQNGNERIMLVDDDEDIIAMVKLMLEHLGYQVVIYSCSMDALEAFRGDSDKFDLIITDMTMPHLSGDKLAVELLKIRPDISILLCTGFSEGMSEEKALSLGIKGFFVKPIVMKDFAEKIREVLEKV